MIADVIEKTASHEVEFEVYTFVIIFFLKFSNTYFSIQLLFCLASFYRFTFMLKHLFCYRHEKVQENCIDLVGRIADRGAEYVSAREWMRICFELLELLKAHKKAIRRATVNTFGYIAKAIG